MHTCMPGFGHREEKNSRKTTTVPNRVLASPLMLHVQLFPDEIGLSGEQWMLWEYGGHAALSTGEKQVPPA